jgi:hypothetical protein
MASIRNTDRSVADNHLDWLKERTCGRASFAIATIKTKHRAVEGAHDTRSIHHHELTGKVIEGQGEMRAAVDVCLDFRPGAMDNKGKRICAFAVTDLFAMTIGNFLNCTEGLTW